MEGSLLAPKDRGAITTVPDAVLAKARMLRAQKLGPGKIWKELHAELVDRVTFDQFKRWIYEGSVAVGDKGSSQDADHVANALGRVAALLERSGIDPDNIGKVSAVKLSEWQGLTKDADGEAQVHDLTGASVVLHPTWETGPAWQPVDRGPAVKITGVSKRNATFSQSTSALKRCFLWPDTQVGYRRDPVTMALEPFHDEQAIACALALLRKVKPDRVIVVGDFLDFPEFGTYEQEPGFAMTVQPSIDRATTLLAEIVAAAAGAPVTFIEGNHDRRLQKSILRNAMAAFGLKRGNAEPEEWPVLSVPYLLRMDELGVDYVGGYPAGLVWINERLAAIHGHKINSAGSTASRVVDDARVSIVFGHTHRLELMHRTRQAYEGARRSLAASLGCLCSLTGTVPSTKSSIDVFGRSVPTVENWQHGVGVVHYESGDGFFHLDLIPIQDGRAVLWAQEVAA